jgi:hypothetical protein
MTLRSLTKGNALRVPEAQQMFVEAEAGSTQAAAASERTM